MTSVLDFDAMVRGLMALGVPRAKAEARARRELGLAVPAPDVAEDALEAKHTAEGDRIMLALGFAVVRLEQRRATKIHLGVPDRRYYHERRRLFLWWEAKSATGKQRPEQRDFQRLCDATGDPYVLGPVERLVEWLVAQRVVTQEAGGVLEPVPFEDTGGAGEAGEGGSDEQESAADSDA